MANSYMNIRDISARRQLAEISAGKDIFSKKPLNNSAQNYKLPLILVYIKHHQPSTSCSLVMTYEPKVTNFVISYMYKVDKLTLATIQKLRSRKYKKKMCTFSMVSNTTTSL